jgi:muconate cycloisomerase
MAKSKLNKIEKIEIYHINVPFKERFTHSTKSRKSSENIILKIYSKNNVGYGESIPREYVTGETPKLVIKTLKSKIIPHFKNIQIKSKTQIL